MPTNPYYAPQLVGVGQTGMSPQIVPAITGQNQSTGAFNAWKRGDFLVNTNVGTIVTPSGGATSGGTTLANVAGPALAPGQGAFTIISSSTSITSGAVTVAATSASGAAAATYYCLLTYTSTTGSNESMSSNEFIITCPQGLTPTVNVASASAPTGAATFALYVGLFPGYEALQQASKYTTTLGSAFTIPNPLTNSIGLAQAATNASGSIFGMAVDDSNALFYNGPAAVGNQSLFGVSMTQPPLTAADAYNNLVYKMQVQQFEISLVQAWYPSVAGASVAGLLLDPTTGFFVADTSQSNKLLSILYAANGPQSYQGGVGQTGTRVVAQFASGLV